MNHVVGPDYEKLITGLDKNPMKLNEMNRALREPNFSNLRTILRNTKLQGDPIFAYLLEHSEEVGIS
jgi:hypothetical protein